MTFFWNLIGCFYHYDLTIRIQLDDASVYVILFNKNQYILFCDHRLSYPDKFHRQSTVTPPTVHRWETVTPWSCGTFQNRGW